MLISQLKQELEELANFIGEADGTMERASRENESCRRLLGTPQEKEIYVRLELLEQVPQLRPALLYSNIVLGPVLRHFRAEKGAHWWFFVLVLPTSVFAKGRRFFGILRLGRCLDSSSASC
jgi:hypothetical protein